MSLGVCQQKVKWKNSRVQVVNVISAAAISAAISDVRAISAAIKSAAAINHAVIEFIDCV